MNCIDSARVPSVLLVFAAVTLIATGCATPQVERDLKQVKANAERDVAIVETGNLAPDGEYIHVYYQCKKEQKKLVCQRACGDKFKCPAVPGMVNASVSPEAHGGPKAGKADQAAGAGDTGADEGGTPSPMDKAKEGVTDDSGTSKKEKAGDQKESAADKEKTQKNGEEDAKSDDSESKSDKEGTDKEGGQ